MYISILLSSLSYLEGHLGGRPVGRVEGRLKGTYRAGQHIDKNELTQLPIHVTNLEGHAEGLREVLGAGVREEALRE